MFNIPYGSDPQQALDLFLPAAATAAPMVLFIHGGGWSAGDKWRDEPAGDHLAREGFVTVLANYRLSPGVQHPAHAQDVARAVAWCRRYGPRFGANPDRLCLMGHSSGAHLVASVALDRTYLAAEGLDRAVVQGVIGIAGAGYDLDASYAMLAMAPLLIPAFGPDCSRWADAAPVRHVHANAPPFLLIHGLDDMQAPPSSTAAFAAALQHAGVATELALLPGEDHTSVMVAAEPLVMGFLRRLQAAQPD
jgi:acetyl esterase/lipase